MSGRGDADDVGSSETGFGNGLEPGFKSELVLGGKRPAKVGGLKVGVLAAD